MRLHIHNHHDPIIIQSNAIIALVAKIRGSLPLSAMIPPASTPLLRSETTKLSHRERGEQVRGLCQASRLKLGSGTGEDTNADQPGRPGLTRVILRSSSIVRTIIKIAGTIEPTFRNLDRDHCRLWTLAP